MKPLILVTNDDGINARGINALVEAVCPLGDVVVVAPDGPRSAQSNASTVNTPLRIWKHFEKDGLSMFRCNGTPADCVKIGLYRVLDRKPDVVVSGINHGSNSSISVIYSGTMGAVFEACIEGIPAAGFSLCSFDPRADFTEAINYSAMITKKILDEGLPKDVCLNVNIPECGHIKGMKISRQCYGRWQERFVLREDPAGNNYFWLTGDFTDHEPDAEDTDEAVMRSGFVSVVPCRVDMTDYEAVKSLQSWNYDAETL